VNSSSSSAQPSKAITIAQAELTADVSCALIAALNTELEAMYPEPGATHFGLAPEEVSGTRGAFLIIYEDGTPVGCGAVRLLDAETGELKRMYVAPDARSRGLGKQLVAALETSARTLGARRLVLETGIRQHAAIKCYRACGFESIPLYGEYLLSPNTSLCLGKAIAVVDC
jgi:putative acetyltransferase